MKTTIFVLLVLILVPVYNPEIPTYHNRLVSTQCTMIHEYETQCIDTVLVGISTTHTGSLITHTYIVTAEFQTLEERITINR